MSIANARCFERRHCGEGKALRYQILDAYLGVNYVNRSEQFYNFFKPDFDTTIKRVKYLKARVKGNKPDADLKKYTGNYYNELYGQVSVTSDKNELIIHFPHTKNLEASLQYMDNDEWLLTYNNLAFGLFPLKFKISNEKVISMDVKVNDVLEFDPYTFVKE